MKNLNGILQAYIGLYTALGKMDTLTMSLRTIGVGPSLKSFSSIFFQQCFVALFFCHYNKYPRFSLYTEENFLWAHSLEGLAVIGWPFCFRPMARRHIMLGGTKPLTSQLGGDTGEEGLCPIISIKHSCLLLPLPIT